jgi:hypothetical protein
MAISPGIYDAVTWPGSQIPTGSLYAVRPAFLLNRGLDFLVVHEQRIFYLKYAFP